MEEEKKKNTFLFVFSTYLPMFLLRFRLGELVGCIIWFRIQRVPTLHTFDGPRYPKNKKYIFSGISCFWGGGVHQKYVVWVLVGCGIKFRIQRALPIKIWVKIRTQKSSFFLSSSKINPYYFIILTIILLFSLGGPFYTPKFL